MDEYVVSLDNLKMFYTAIKHSLLTKENEQRLINDVISALPRYNGEVVEV